MKMTCRMKNLGTSLRNSMELELHVFVIETSTVSDSIFPQVPLAIGVLTSSFVSLIHLNVARRVHHVSEHPNYLGVREH